jgi:hypothetical protein
VYVARRDLEPLTIVEISGASKWLESAFSLSKHNSLEWSGDFLFKTPFSLSNTLELMIGAGPAWSHTNRTGHIRRRFLRSTS